jgi:hypothetical protein
MDLRTVILSEIQETDTIPVSLSNLFVSMGQTNVLQLVYLFEQKEPDVYVNNYYEEIVSRYSEATYKSHFRMTRVTMAVSVNIFLQYYGN